MPKSKNKKDHKKRVNARNAKIKLDKQRYEKARKELFLKMIEEEKNKGLFENLPQISPMENTKIDLGDGPAI